jgi:hypothetical protein
MHSNDYPDLLADLVAHHCGHCCALHRMGGRMSTTLGLLALLAFAGIIGLVIYACAELMGGILDEEDDDK